MTTVSTYMSSRPAEDSAGTRTKDTKHSSDGIPELTPEGTESDKSESPISFNLPGPLESNVMSALARANASASPSKGQNQQFEPLDKSACLTVKLNPKLELGRNDLLKLLSCMEAELQARDVVIATLKSERLKSFLHYGKTGLNDPFLALQRDNIGGRIIGGANISDLQLRNIEETQLQQLEILITQQRRANQRMAHILKEAEKRHSWTVQELEKERKKHEHDTAQGDEVTYHLEVDRSRLKQELDYERSGRRKAEKDLKKALETLEEERGKQKQIVLMLVEERKRLALQYAEERKRSEDLAQILSEEKGRIDTMADGLEEESKKSLQMEAELEKQLAEFDTERQQMRAQLAKRDERIAELEIRVEKLHHEGEHYRKQLQEAHNVAMFQQTLSVSPPRLGVSSPRAQPPQVPAKPTTLTQGQQRLQATPALSNVTKAVQLTATANSVPVTGPTTGIARSVQSAGAPARPVIYSSQSNEISRTITTTAKTFSEGDVSWLTSTADISEQRPSQLQVSPRVNVSASPGSKVITTTHGGKVTLHVTTNPSSASPSLTLNGGTTKKPLPPARSSTIGGTLPPVPNKPNVPPVPPNKPIVPPKKDLSRTIESPISVEVKPQKMGSQTVKFGITISKTGTKEHSGAVSPALESGSRPAQVEDAQLHDSLSPELESFHQLLSSMAGSADIENHVDEVSSSISSVMNNTSINNLSDPLQDGTSSNETIISDSSILSSHLTSSNPINTNDIACATPQVEPLFLDVEIDNIEPPHSPLDVASPLTEDGMTALHLAAQGNNWESVPTLVECGSSIYAEDELGQTPAYIALINGCTAAAKTLLMYVESMEQVTKDGSNFLHGAIKSGNIECVQLLLDRLLMLDPEKNILHMLITSPDNENKTPLVYAVEYPCILKILANSTSDFPALVAYCPGIYHQANGSVLEILNDVEKAGLTCPVWLQGASIFSETEESPKYAIGCITLTSSTSWSDAEDQIALLLLNHWQNICRDLDQDQADIDINTPEKPDEDGPIESPLDLKIDSVDCIAVGSHFWKMGCQTNNRSPHELISACRATESSDITVHLKPHESVAYTCLIPTSLLQNYLRILDQSKCLIVYGSKGSGKKTLVHGLATLYCGSFSRDAFTRIDMDRATDDSMHTAIQQCFKDGSVLILEKLPQESWKSLAKAVKAAPSGRRGGRLLATMDSWRRPAGQIYNGVIVQLRHDREPLGNFLWRWSARHLCNIGCGRLPPVNSQLYETVKWVAESYQVLSEMLMSLGFSSVLRGPHLFARQLVDAYNARDALVKMNEVWWQNLAPAICEEVDNVWTVWQKSGKQPHPDKKKISAMALHVIQHRTFLCELPPCSRFYPKIVQASESQKPRPTELPLQSPVKSDVLTSPEWTPDNLSKILGLSPMDYL